MNKKVIIVIGLVLFLCICTLGSIGVFSFYWLSTEPYRALDQSQRNFAEVEKAEYEIDIALPVTYRISGITMALDIDITGDGIIDIEDEEFSFDGELSLPDFFGAIDMDDTKVKAIYADKYIYVYNDIDDEWTKTKYDDYVEESNNDAIPTPDLSEIDDIAFSYTGTGTVNDEPVYVYTASADTDELNDLMEPYIDEVIQNAIDENSDSSYDYLSTMGIDLEEMTIEFSKLDVEYKVYKATNLPASIKILLSIDYTMGEGMAFSIDDAEITITFTEYEDVGNIIIPRFAREIDLSGGDINDDIFDITPSVYPTSPNGSDTITNFGFTTIGNSPVLGDIDSAQIAIVEFSDYQCAFCKMYHSESYQQLVDEYVETGEAIYVYKNYIAVPRSGLNSEIEARTSICVQELTGDAQFYDFNDFIYEGMNTGSSGFPGGVTPLIDEAVSMGIDRSAMLECLEDASTEIRFNEDLDAANEAYITGTPTFIIGYFNSNGTITGYVIDGVQSLESFRETLDELIAMQD